MAYDQLLLRALKIMDIVPEKPTSESGAPSGALVATALAADPHVLIRACRAVAAGQLVLGESTSTCPEFLMLASEWSALREEQAAAEAMCAADVSVAGQIDEYLPGTVPREWLRRQEQIWHWFQRRGYMGFADMDVALHRGIAQLEDEAIKHATYCDQCAHAVQGLLGQNWSPF